MPTVGRASPNFILQFTFSCNSLVHDPGLDQINVIKKLLNFKLKLGLFIQEGDSITKRRTAATSALSARWLAPKCPKILAILGAGHQALAHMQVLLDQYPSIEEIHLWNHRKVKAINLGTNHLLL